MVHRGLSILIGAFAFSGLTLTAQAEIQARPGCVIENRLTSEPNEFDGFPGITQWTSAVEVCLDGTEAGLYPISIIGHFAGSYQTDAGQLKGGVVHFEEYFDTKGFLTDARGFHEFTVVSTKEDDPLPLKEEFLAHFKRQGDDEHASAVWIPVRKLVQKYTDKPTSIYNVKYREISRLLEEYSSEGVLYKQDLDTELSSAWDRNGQKFWSEYKEYQRNGTAYLKEDHWRSINRTYEFQERGVRKVEQEYQRSTHEFASGVTVTGSTYRNLYNKLSDGTPRTMLASASLTETSPVGPHRTLRADLEANWSAEDGALKEILSLSSSLIPALQQHLIVGFRLSPLDNLFEYTEGLETHVHELTFAPEREVVFGKANDALGVAEKLIAQIELEINADDGASNVAVELVRVAGNTLGFNLDPVQPPVIAPPDADKAANDIVAVPTPTDKIETPIVSSNFTKEKPGKKKARKVKLSKGNGKKTPPIKNERKPNKSAKKNR